MNKQRVINKGRNHLSKHVADIPIHTFYKTLETPNVKEGFEEVMTL